MSRALTPHPPPVPQSKQVMDDFVRNFMVRMGLTGTLEKFETEWYEMEATGKLNNRHQWTSMTITPGIVRLAHAHLKAAGKRERGGGAR